MSENKMVSGLLCSASMLLCVSNSALAQESDRAEAVSEAGAPEIIVTAQRRAERLLDVPIAITAADGETLIRSGVRNIENISSITPSISFRANKDASSSGNIQIRGVGTTGTAYSFEGAVGVFIDGAYRTRSGQALSSFLDVGSLQVLRGPQGTLFGKNTSAGAILITSTEPSTDRVEGSAEASYGNYDTYAVRGALNVPISDSAALRVSGVVNGRDGYFHDPSGNDLDRVKNSAVKAQILLTPTDNLSVKLIADYSHTGGNCCYATVIRTAGAIQPVVAGLTLANGLQLPSTNPHDRQALLNEIGSYTRIKDYGATLKLEWRMGGGTLTSITALRKFKEDINSDPDFSGADIIRVRTLFQSRFLSQELTFSGETTGSLKTKYVVGGFFSDENLSLGRWLTWGNQAQAFANALLAGAIGAPPGTANAAPGLLSEEQFPSTAKSLAAFAHWTIELSPKFNVIAGIRYTREIKTVRFENPFFRDPARDPFALLRSMPGRLYSDRSEDNIISGTLGLQFKPNHDTMFYVTYNRGAKAGGVTIDVNAAGTPTTQANPVYRPEKVDTYELGAKLRWLDGRANTSIALFYNDLHDLQVAQFLGLNFVVLNSPSAKSYGVELDQTLRLNDAMTLSVGGIYLPEATFGSSPTIGILSGRRFLTAPKFSGNASLNLAVPVSSNVEFTGLVQVEYRGRQFTSNSVNAEQVPIALLNANIGLKTIGRGWAIEAYGLNLTNKTYVTFDGLRPLQRGTVHSYLGAPRTYGLRVRHDF